jgi:S1-C subfamily serine protease
MKKTLAVLVSVFVLMMVPLVVACSDDDDGPTGATSPGNVATAAQTTVTEGRSTPSVTGASSSASPASGQGSGAGNALTRTVQSAEASLPDLIDQVRSSVVTVFVDQGEGSGVIWDDEGNIVTNNHVVENATNVEVVLASGEHLPGSVVATDPLTDLAVVHVDRTDLQPAKFSDKLPRVGTLVLAIGNPLGFESSATLGIVSGVNREIPSGGQAPALVDLLQTDAAISPGNSGGALIDMDGEVIGINVAYIPPSQSAVSLGFAIPSPTAIDVVEQLLKGGTVEHSFLGIEPRPLTPQIASQLGLSVSEGVFVFSLTEGGPAEQAGIQPGDVIVGFGDKDIASIEDLYAALRDVAPGDTVPVKLVREGNDQTVQVTLEDRPAP